MLQLKTDSPILSCTAPKGPALLKWVPLHPAGAMTAAGVSLTEWNVRPLPPGKALAHILWVQTSESSCWAPKSDIGGGG